MFSVILLGSHRFFFCFSMLYYDSRRIKLQMGCQLLAFTTNSDPFQLLHFYGELRKKYSIWMSPGGNQFKHTKFSKSLLSHHTKYCTSLSQFTLRKLTSYFLQFSFSIISGSLKYQAFYWQIFSCNCSC